MQSRKLFGAPDIRDQLNDLGYCAVIVMDEPNLRGTFTAEDKVIAYMERLGCVRGAVYFRSAGARRNRSDITDEIARACTHPRLRENHRA